MAGKTKERVPDARPSEAEQPKTIPPWYEGWVFCLLFERLKINPWLLGALVFAGYWGAPMVLAAASGTLVSREWLASVITRLPTLIRSLGPHQEIINSQQLTGGLAYLNDLSHFAFASVLVPGTWAASWVLTRTHTTVQQMQEDGLPNPDRKAVQELFLCYRRRANHWGFRLFSLLLAGATSLIFLAFHFDDANVLWWGHRSHGPNGLLFAAIEAVMVYFGTQVMILTAFASAMLARIFAGSVRLRPFHPDGANGLAPLGRMIMVFWLLALAIAAAICVTLFLGYLGLERMPLAWMLAIAGLTAIPAIAIVPLASSLRAIHRARGAQIGKFEPLLNAMLKRAEQEVGDGHYEDATATLASLSDVHGVHEALVSLNIWPFNPRALTVVVAAYALQLFLTLKEFLGL